MDKKGIILIIFIVAACLSFVSAVGGVGGYFYNTQDSEDDSNRSESKQEIPEWKKRQNESAKKAIFVPKSGCVKYRTPLRIMKKIDRNYKLKLHGSKAEEAENDETTHSLLELKGSKSGCLEFEDEVRIVKSEYPRYSLSLEGSKLVEKEFDETDDSLWIVKSPNEKSGKVEYTDVINLVPKSKLRRLLRLYGLKAELIRSDELDLHTELEFLGV